jgi:hypothetical protein
MRAWRGSGTCRHLDSGAQVRSQIALGAISENIRYRNNRVFTYNLYYHACRYVILLLLPMKPRCCVNHFLVRLYTNSKQGIITHARETRLILASTPLRDQCSPPVLLTINLVCSSRSSWSSCSCWGCRQWRRDVIHEHRSRRRRSCLRLCRRPIRHDTVTSLMIAPTYQWHSALREQPRNSWIHFSGHTLHMIISQRWPW